MLIWRGIQSVPYLSSSLAVKEISDLLNTGLDDETLRICVQLLEAGVNPEALANVVQELRREVAALRVCHVVVIRFHINTSGTSTSLSLSLSHTHTHTHSLSLSLPLSLFLPSPPYIYISILSIINFRKKRKQKDDGSCCQNDSCFVCYSV